MLTIGYIDSDQDARYLLNFSTSSFIQSGHVLLNGAVETRRSRKIRPGDQVTLGDVTVEVAWEDEDPS